MSHPPEVQELYDAIIAKMHETHRDLIAPETVCVHDAANSENVELLRIFLKHLESTFSLRTIRDTYHQTRRFSRESPDELITEHGLEMRSIVSMALASNYNREDVEPIYVLALSLTEQEVHRALSIISRGVLKVDDIRALIIETGLSTRPLIDGVL